MQTELTLMKRLNTKMILTQAALFLQAGSFTTLLHHFLSPFSYKGDFKPCSSSYETKGQKFNSNNISQAMKRRKRIVLRAEM